MRSRKILFKGPFYLVKIFVSHKIDDHLFAPHFCEEDTLHQILFEIHGMVRAATGWIGSGLRGWGAQAHPRSHVPEPMTVMHLNEIMAPENFYSVHSRNEITLCGQKGNELFYTLNV